MTQILTSTGRQHQLTGSSMFEPGNAPSLREIAHSLAQINRYTGHASRPMSVAEHSLLVADTARAIHGANPAVQLAALMHDAHECLTGDVATPIKQVLGDTWRAFERSQQALVLLSFRLDQVFEDNEALIKNCDLIALATERRDLMPFDINKHDPWPSLDTIGRHVIPRSTNLNDPSRTACTWSQWAWQFEAHATTLMQAVADQAEIAANAARRWQDKTLMTGVRAVPAQRLAS
jgi:hypothetical protein